jgi:hypothetical protein
MARRAPGIQNAPDVSAISESRPDQPAAYGWLGLLQQLGALPVPAAATS